MPQQHQVVDGNTYCNGFTLRAFTPLCSEPSTSRCRPQHRSQTSDPSTGFVLPPLTLDCARTSRQMFVLYSCCAQALALAPSLIRFLLRFGFSRADATMRCVPLTDLRSARLLQPAVSPECDLVGVFKLSIKNHNI